MEMIRKAGNGIVLTAKVRASSVTFTITSKGGFLEIRTRSPAEGNRANIEIVKELSRLFGREVRIVRGLKSRHKEILIQGASPEEIEKLIAKDL